MECHEKWEWEEGTEVGNIQRLVGLQALCPACHKVKHLGLTELREGEIGLEKAKAQLMMVNKWDIETTNSYINAMFEQWEERSRKKWKVEWRDFDREVSEILGKRMARGGGGFYRSNRVKQNELKIAAEKVLRKAVEEEMDKARKGVYGSAGVLNGGFTPKNILYFEDEKEKSKEIKTKKIGRVLKLED